MQTEMKVHGMGRGFGGRMARGVLPVAAASVCLLLAGSLAPAATTVWTGSSAGGVFNDDANWSGLTPGNADPSDLGIFNSGTNVNGTITFNADASHKRTFVQNTAGTIAFDTGANTWTMSSFFLTGTSTTEDNNIQFINGHVIAQMYLMGNTAGATNGDIIEVIGPNTILEGTTTGGAFRVGSGGSDNTQFIIRDGGTAIAPGQIIIGLVSSGNGLMRVTGAGSTATVGGSIQVGGGNSAQSENNRLEILAGGHVTGNQLLMGVTDFGDNNTTLVSGANSILSILDTGRSDIGRFGGGHTLQIDNGGAVDGAAHYTIGVEATSTGNQILVNGAGASLTGSGVEAIRGSLNVNGGGVTLNDFFNVGNGAFEGGNLIANAGATGAVNLNSGSISTVNADIANGSAFVVGDGGANPATYNMMLTGDGNNGSHSFADGLSLSSNATLSGNGDITGNVSGSAGALVNVGLSPGVINVAGDWDNTGLNIGLEVDNPVFPGAPGDQYDLLNISGAFTHGGDVVIDVSEFLLPPGTTPLKLIGWGSEVGLSSDTNVTVVGGSIPVQFQSDGLYVLVPEPTTAGLLGFAVVGLLARRRTR
jgi:hypothetical protein